jgi:hypothetical protein
MAWMSFGLPRVGLSVSNARVVVRRAMPRVVIALRGVFYGVDTTHGWGASCARVVGGWMGASRRSRVHLLVDARGH